MKPKRIAKVGGLVVCVLMLMAVLSNWVLNNAEGGIEFVVVPKNWKLSLRQSEILTIYKTNGVAENFTNRVSHIGPIVFTEFNH